MRIIRLEIEIISRNYTIQVLRQAIGLDRRSIKNIREFVDYVKVLCNLKGKYEIDIDGFSLAPNDTIEILKESSVYTLKLARESIVNAQINDDQQSDQNLQEYSGKNKASPTPKSRHCDIKKSKIQQKNTKQHQKNRLLHKEKMSQQSEEESESESEEQQIYTIRRKNINRYRGGVKKVLLKQNIQKKQIRQPESSSSEFSMIQKKVKQPLQIMKLISSSGSQSSESPIIQKKVKQPVQKKKIISSSDSQSSQSPIIQKKVKQPVQKKKVISSSDSQSSELPIIQKKAKQPLNNNPRGIIVEKKLTQPVINENKVKLGVGIKKSIIRVSSSQSSPSKEKTPQAERKKILSVEPQKFVQQSKVQNLKLPPALRNKIQTNKFEKHQQNQWIIVDKEKYHKWQQLGHKTLSQPPNKIRFKIVQLDEEKFIPVKSNWITGEVASTTESGVVHLANAQQEGKDFMKTYQIPQMNMDELQIFKPLATKEQIQCLCGSNKEENQKQAERAEPIKTEVTLLHDPPNSVEKFVCGQVNYYFSDKNYLTDCYMQLHANSHPQKYMKLSFMLNFPKIKKVLRDEEKLLDYLREDDKYESRNYEINFVNKMIRKKNIIIQPKNTLQANELQMSQEKEIFPKSAQVKDD